MAKISPECVTYPEQVSAAVGSLPSASGPASLGMAFPALLVKLLYRCDSVVMPGNRLPRVMKHYPPTGRKNHGRPLKMFLDT